MELTRLSAYSTLLIRHQCITNTQTALWTQSAGVSVERASPKQNALFWSNNRNVHESETRPLPCRYLVHRAALNRAVAASTLWLQSAWRCNTSTLTPNRCPCMPQSWCLDAHSIDTANGVVSSPLGALSLQHRRALEGAHSTLCRPRMPGGCSYRTLFLGTEGFWERAWRD